MVFLQLNSSLISLILTAFGARMIKKSNEMENFMKLLEERILKDGVLKDGGILKVDSFLNHQMDIGLLQEIGKEFRRLFPENITRILTIEASGIGIATITAQYFDNIPVVFAKKSMSKNLDGDLLTSKVISYTKGLEFDIFVEKKFLSPDDNILIIDDFLANGQALNGLIDLVNGSGANLVGCGIVIEKGFQDGGQIIREKGVHLESLAIVEDPKDGKLCFREQ